MSKKKPYRYTINIDGLIFTCGISKMTEKEAIETLNFIHKAQGQGKIAYAEAQRKETTWMEGI